MKIELPNECWMSQPTVNPSNWKTCGIRALNNDWYIQYYFHDKSFGDDPKLKNGKLFIVKGMNGYKTLDERRGKTQAIFNQLISDLQAGYNPITKKKIDTTPIDYEIAPNTYFIQALEAAFERLNHGPASTKNVKSALNYIKPAIIQLGYSSLKISEVKNRQIGAILERVGHNKGNVWTSSNYNKYRGALSHLFSILVNKYAVEYNPVTNVPKMDHDPKVPELLSKKEREKISEYLKEHFPRFWLFMQIFFHSGARTTELLQVKVKDVDLSGQFFNVVILKGKKKRVVKQEASKLPKPVKKPIKDIALAYWIEAIGKGLPEQYVFAKGLVPGDVPITRPQIDRRWKRIVIDGLGINKAFYSLKHLNSDMVEEELGMEDAAALNSHTSTKMVEEIYAVGAKGRQMERIKKVRNEF